MVIFSIKSYLTGLWGEISEYLKFLLGNGACVCLSHSIIGSVFEMLTQ